MYFGCGKSRLAFLALFGLSLMGCGDEGSPNGRYVGDVAIRDVRVFDGTTAIDRATVIVRGDRIVTFGAGVSIPGDVAIINGAGKTLLPGLIDAHAHVWNSGDLAQAALFGTTTVLDMGTCNPASAVALRRASAEPGSTMAELRTAGFLVTTPDGHGTRYCPIPTMTEPSEAQAFVDARIAEGSDYIKIVYDDGRALGLSFKTLTKAALAAVVEAAHARGKLALVHIGALQDAVDAIEVGADGLEHLFIDKIPTAEFATLLASHGAFAVPTLSVLSSVTGASTGPSIAADPKFAPYLTPTAVKGLTTAFDPLPTVTSYGAAEETVRLLKEAHVPLLAGTDAPNPGTAHGASVHTELRLLVAAGLTPIEALAAATRVPAERFKLADRGRIGTGARADLLLVNGDPTVDIHATADIATVWKAGARLDR